MGNLFEADWDFGATEDDLHTFLPQVRDPLRASYIKKNKKAVAELRLQS